MSLNTNSPTTAKKLTTLQMLHHPMHAIGIRLKDITSHLVIDPFVEAKKKCLPSNIKDISSKEGDNIPSETLYYFVAPFTITDRDGPSFTDNKMSNLIIDNDGKLMKLINVYETQKSLPPNQTYIEAKEYCNSEGDVIARKFQKYISVS